MNASLDLKRKAARKDAWVSKVYGTKGGVGNNEVGDGLI